jgi:hypothetical protein
MATNAPAVLTNATISQANTQYCTSVEYLFDNVLANKPDALDEWITYLGNRLEKFLGNGFDSFNVFQEKIKKNGVFFLTPPLKSSRVASATMMRMVVF